MTPSAPPDSCERCKERGHVLESRPTEDRDIHYRRRRYECPTCGYRWTTFETLIDPREAAAYGRVVVESPIRPTLTKPR